MSRWHNNYVDGYAHFCTFTVRAWKPLLVGKAVDTLYDEWTKASARFSVSILAYVIMPEHVHVLLWSPLGRNITVFLQRTLGEMSKRLCPGEGGMWKERPRVFPVYSESVIKEKVEYIHRNPVRRGLVDDASAWPHSSLRQLATGDTEVPFLCDAFPSPK